MSIDRNAPGRRPTDRAVGFQRWRDLLFMHWPVPEAALRPLVPRRLAIDRYAGVAYVGLVPFAMEGVRPRWAPERAALRFLEANVRTYVHVDGRDPGVYFLSLDAASRLAVAVARRQWGLPYFHAAMRLRRRGDEYEYRSRRLDASRAGLDVRYDVGEAVGPASPGTLEHFLIERYLLHIERGRTLWTGQVHHPPYRIRKARVADLGDGLIAAAGLPRPDGPPPLVHYAAGVDVEVFAPRRR